ncbi:MAG: hypothetical protein EPO28_18630 [Saprospiraceae bacterium]|nr:MAG: hypothetical protein EPO28_18630 [Saprospiraceae bacterium]
MDKSETCLTCDAPNVTKTGETDASISFDWDGVFGASAYILRYYREEDDYTSSDVFPTNSEYTWSNLPGGSYTFYFITRCGSETSSSFIVIDDIAGT